MNFFCTKKCYDLWTEEMGTDESQIFCLDGDEALAVAKMLFSLEEP